MTTPQLRDIILDFLSFQHEFEKQCKPTEQQVRLNTLQVDTYLSDPVKQFDGWISVEHRLPENGNWMLVCYEGKPQAIPCSFHTKSKDWYEYAYPNKVTSKVTHFQPFPKPPKND